MLEFEFHFRFGGKTFHPLILLSEYCCDCCEKYLILFVNQRFK